MRHPHLGDSTGSGVGRWIPLIQGAFCLGQTGPAATTLDAPVTLPVCALGEGYNPSAASPHPDPTPTPSPVSLAASCAAGRFLDVASLRCVACAVGTYQPEVGAVFCFRCPAGETTVGGGAVSVDACSGRCGVADSRGVSTSAQTTSHQ